MNLGCVGKFVHQLYYWLLFDNDLTTQVVWARRKYFPNLLKNLNDFLSFSSIRRKIANHKSWGLLNGLSSTKGLNFISLDGVLVKPDPNFRYVSTVEYAKSDPCNHSWINLPENKSILI